MRQKSLIELNLFQNDQKKYNFAGRRADSRIENDGEKVKNDQTEDNSWENDGKNLPNYMEAEALLV